MILFKKAIDLAQHLQRERLLGQRVGFVPTMGALHQGHLSLIEASRQCMSLTVCSIFVNPTQFNDPGDFQKYPVSIEQDIYLLEKSLTDILYLPTVMDIYPNGTSHLEKYELGRIEHLLEGKYRPGHFQGVCQVMGRLLKLVKPTGLFMGQKDYQKCMVIKRLLQILQIPVEFHICPTLREGDGLAMSSRNRRLSEEERRNAPAIYQALSHIRDNLHTGPLASLIASAGQILLDHQFKADYIAIADPESLEPLAEYDGNRHLVGLIAAFQQETRLIDNLQLH